MGTTFFSASNTLQVHGGRAGGGGWDERQRCGLRHHATLLKLRALPAPERSRRCRPSPALQGLSPPAFRQQLGNELGVAELLRQLLGLCAGQGQRRVEG